MSGIKHRKRVKHFNQPRHAHELTFSCYRRLRLLDDDHIKSILSAGIDAAMASKGFELVAFVYMPEHVHLIVFPVNEQANISQLLSHIKRPTSYRIKQYLQQGHLPLLEQLTIRERPGKTTFRFWQEGPGYDRNIDHPSTLGAAIDYLHANPIRRGLCRMADQWPWSSWHHYEGDACSRVNLPRVHGMPDLLK
jgi:putative transposase